MGCVGVLENYQTIKPRAARVDDDDEIERLLLGLDLPEVPDDPLDGEIPRLDDLDDWEGLQ